MDSAGNSAWPEMFPIERIQELERIVGPRHFSAQMMLEYVPEERIHLDPGAIHFYTDEFDNRTARIGEHLISGGAIYWDPSTARNGADGSVCALIYRDDRNMNAFVHDILYLCVADNDVHPLASQCETILNFLTKHKINRIGIEINGIGNALPEIIRRIANSHGMSVNIVQIANHTKKETRILNSIEPMLSTGRLFMHERIKQTMLLSEMLAWTPMGSVEHDDGLDAVSGALSMTPISIRPVVNHIGLIRANTEFKI